jgi:ABC-type branched-subunit amino acid transport system substrate-binding protein
MMDPSLAAAAGAAMTAGIKGSDVSFGTPKFVAAFNEFVKGKNISYVAKAAHAFDAAEALIEARRRAAERRAGAAIAAELPNVRFEGASGPVAFDEAGDLKFSPDKSYDVLEFTPKGQLKVVETS